MGFQFIDKRGSFSNVLKRPDWDVSRRAIYQINVSTMTKVGTLKGLHWQTGEFAEYRQVTCLIGKIFDVVVDIRPESPTFLQWQAVELAGLDGQSVLIPPGFAHAVQSLTANCMVHYIHSLTYEPKYEAGLNALDPAIAIKWPLEPTNMSDRDLGLPTVHELFGGAGRVSASHV